MTMTTDSTSFFRPKHQQSCWQLPLRHIVAGLFTPALVVSSSASEAFVGVQRWMAAYQSRKRVVGTLLEDAMMARDISI